MLFALMVFASGTPAQTKLVPVEITGPKPANALKFREMPIQGWVSVEGHWMALDKNNELAGFSYSKIYCTKRDRICLETASSVIPNVGLQVSVDSNEYEILSWREDGLSARYVGGACKVAHTLEISFKTGNVLITDSPTEVNPKMDFCPKASASYQLIEGNGFMVVAKKP